MSDAVLIAALSGRALAAAARRSGLRPYVLDLFGDLDTLDLAEAHRRVGGDVFGGIDDGGLPAAAHDLDEAAGETLPLVYGAGLEGRSDLLARLAEGRALLGNRPETVAGVKDPRVFFEALDDLGLAHPTVSHRPPSDARGWLAKRIGGSGGLHIRPAAGRSTDADVYYQKREAGQPLGVSFLADGGDARLLSVNGLWTAAPNRDDCYLFGGMAGPVILAEDLQRRLEETVRTLVRRFTLAGLNSLDLLLDGDRLLVLEINPRPGVSVDLYRQTGQYGILARHLAACRGVLPDLEQDPPVAGVQVVYARKDITVAAQEAWPDWLADRPAPGVRVSDGEPLCSVVSAGRDLDDCRERLAARAEICLATLSVAVQAVVQ